MRHGRIMVAGIFAAALLAGAGMAQEPVKAAEAKGGATPAVSDTGGNEAAVKSGSEYRVKALGVKFKTKETRSGEKVKGTNIKITPVKVKKSGVEYKVKETGEKFKVKETRAGARAKGTSGKNRAEKFAARSTPAAKVTPVAPSATPAAPAPVAGAADAGVTPAR